MTSRLHIPLLLLLCLAGCGNGPRRAYEPRRNDAEALLLGAQFALAQRDPQVALARCQQMSGELSVEAWLTLAQAYRANEQPQQAERELRACLAANPGETRIRRTLADLLVATKRPKEAAEQLHIVVSREPDDTTAALALARAELQAGRREAAERVLRKLVQRQPKSLTAAQGLSELLWKSGKRDAGIACLRKVAKALPESVEAQVSLGALLQFAGRLAESEKAYQRALTIEPKSPDALNNLAFLYLMQDRDLPTAERLARTAASQDPQNGQYLDTLGWVLFRQGRHEDAYAPLTAAHANRPRDPEITYHLAACHAKLGLRGSALELTKAALASPASFPKKGECQALQRKLRPAPQSEPRRGAPWAKERS